MKERPILFSTPMVQAILAGRKTQTRRIVTSRNSIHGNRQMWDALDFKDAFPDGMNGLNYLKVARPADETRHRVYPKWEVGDRLWVRESFAIIGSDPIRGGEGEILVDRFIYAYRGQKQPHIEKLYKWKPSIHMPREASRILLEVVKVRVEQLNQIGENDAMAEGMTLESPRWFKRAHVFQELWEKIHGEGSWQTNPWVWVIEFKRIEG